MYINYTIQVHCILNDQTFQFVVTVCGCMSNLSVDQYYEVDVLTSMQGLVSSFIDYTIDERRFL